MDQLAWLQKYFSIAQRSFDAAKMRTFFTQRRMQENV